VLFERERAGVNNRDWTNSFADALADRVVAVAVGEDRSRTLEERAFTKEPATSARVTAAVGRAVVAVEVGVAEENHPSEHPPLVSGQVALIYVRSNLGALAVTDEHDCGELAALGDELCQLLLQLRFPADYRVVVGAEAEPR
jgi:hypothetical protein